MNEIEIYGQSGRVIRTKTMVFSGGELKVGLDSIPPNHGDIKVLARLQDAASIIKLMMATEIIKRHTTGLRTLIIPYFPYARQDRVTVACDAFTLKPFAALINSLGYDRVVTYDVHSDVTPALVDRLQVISQQDIVTQCLTIFEGLHIVAPDAGATKKAFGIAQAFGRNFIAASKVRDVATGQILRTEVGCESIDGDCLIVDDICDGGRTFTELAKALKAKGAAKVHLYVTHGIFSQGLAPFEGLIDSIFCTDTFLSAAKEEGTTAFYQQPLNYHEV